MGKETKFIIKNSNYVYKQTIFINKKYLKTEGVALEVLIRKHTHKNNIYVLFLRSYVILNKVIKIYVMKKL